MKSILITGASGKLGKRIVELNSKYILLQPSRSELDITNEDSVCSYFTKFHFDGIIHCAALARMLDCENNPSLAIKTNTIGTANLVSEVFKRNMQDKLRFIHISTDGVYQGDNGNYSEIDQTIPYNIYGWTKLGAESSVNLLPNHCIIRTRFYDPNEIKFNDYPGDVFTSKLPVDDLVKAIFYLYEHPFIGTVNVGDEKMSEYDRHKLYQSNIVKSSYEEIQQRTKVKLPRDPSMNVSLWNRLK